MVKKKKNVNIKKKKKMLLLSSVFSPRNTGAPLVPEELYMAKE